MRRGFAFALSTFALGLLTPAAFGQYPYPYGPMPYAPPYGYPMPAYVPNPMMARPVYYPQAPVIPPQPERNTKVFVYGPLTDETVMLPPPNAPMMPVKPLAKPDGAAAGVTPAQALLMRGGPQVLPTYSKADLPPDACGPGCNDCGPSCGGREPYEAPMRGKGHFIGEVGAYFLVPLFNPRTAFSTTTAAGTATTEFTRQVDAGPRASLGYVFHTGWGIRADYEYLRGSINQTANNGDPATTITTPLAAFPLTSPSATLGAGIGVDQFNFRQRLELNVFDIEGIKEMGFMDTTFLFSFGARYSRLTQSYSATRTNPGGTNGAVTVALDREDVDAANRFEGWGPTISAEAVHPLKCGFALYGNVRGSFLWGTDRFTQTDSLQRRTVDGAGAPTFTDTNQAIAAFDKRFVPVVETEAGVQFGHRFGHCYLFARTGFVYQRWFDVGNPTAANGSLSFIGGAVRAGIVY